MKEKLLNHIKQNVALYSKTEENYIADFFTLLLINKKEHFLKLGAVCRRAGFVIKGCFRNYVTSSEGKEINTQFSFENWWIGEISSFVSHSPSQVNIQAIEDCQILTITAEGYETLLERSPCFSEYTHKLRSNAHLSAVLRISGLSINANERYKSLLENYPQIEQRVSQKHIASFLQITPEALCRLKKSNYKSKS